MSDAPPLQGLTVGVTADRRAEQQIGLLERRGAAVRWGPVLQSVELSRDGALAQVTRALVQEPPEVLVLLTGQGTTWWLDAADAAGSGGALRAALRRTTILARGSKAASAARRAGLEVAWQAASETTAEVVDHVAATAVGRTVAVQLDGADDDGTLSAIGERTGRPVRAVPVYRWQLPSDPEPARALIRDVVAGRVEAVTFTASPAVQHLAELAAGIGLGAELDDAFRHRVHAVCVGPVCSATARRQGWARIIEPERYRLVPMIDALVEAVAAGHLGPRPGQSPLNR